MFSSKVHITHMFLNLDFPKTGLSGNITTCEIMYVMSLIHYKHSLNVNLLLSFLLPKNKNKIQKSGIKKCATKPKRAVTVRDYSQFFKCCLHPASHVWGRGQEGDPSICCHWRWEHICKNLCCEEIRPG